VARREDGEQQEQGHASRLLAGGRKEGGDGDRTDRPPGGPVLMAEERQHRDTAKVAVSRQRDT
jgi:hypothetical protein